MATLELFWDVGSAYSYLAVKQAPKIVEGTGATLHLRPFLLGGVFKATGNKMPAAIPAKAVYMIRDLTRWREYLGLAMRLPTEGTPFPLNTVLPMRVATAADLEGRGDECCDALFKAYWERSVDVSEPSLLMKVLEQSGLPVSWLERASEQATKDALRATTDEAIARGAFGAPTLFVGDEMFWGNDRMTMVRKCLQ